MTRKEYGRLILFCHFCQTHIKNKNELMLIHLADINQVVKICLRCREIIDPLHSMQTEEMK
jgi:hypothetical protein